MRILWVFLVGLGVAGFLGACQTAPPSQPDILPLTQLAAARNTAPAESLRYTVADITLRLTKPKQWESFSTDHGIVIGERFGSVATAGTLEGLISYIFITPIEDYTQYVTTNRNTAQYILTTLLDSQPHPQKMPTYTPVNAFQWDGYDAAYYLLRGEDDTVTLVIAVLMPEDQALLSVSISAPQKQSARIRATLPTLLHGLMFNEHVFDGNGLHALPDPLAFP